jgi:serine/threonine-protein kinase
MSLPSLTIGDVLGHYRILEQIAAGGMGVVYRAHDERLDRDVALKVLRAGAIADENNRKRFRKEALTLSRLNHPNLAHIYDFDTQDGIDFLVMEFVEGTTLARRIMEGTFPQKEVLELGAQIAQTLQEAHERSVIHRDLKPANIMVTSAGQIKLLDFGLAKLLKPADIATTQSLTEGYEAAGTLPYMSPEQLRGAPSDFRTDIYATGVVLYEMVTGRRPFEEKSTIALADDILHKPPPPPARLNPVLSSKLDDIILKCLEKEANDRYQSAKELAVDLRRLASPGSAHTKKETTPTRHPSLRMTIVAASIILSTLALLFAFDTGWWRERIFGRTAANSIQSLAVLPLENLSHDPSQEYLADGMTDQVIADLSKIQALRVISRTSVMHYKGTNKTLPVIANELNVDAVIEGSVLRSGGRVRVIAQLIQAAGDKPLWTESYERDMDDVLILQRDIARDIAQEIRVTLKPAEQAHLTNTRTGNPRAHEAYLKGLYFWNKWTEEGIRKGIDNFQQAIEIDPRYALAYAGLADAYNALGDFGMGSVPPREAAAKAEAAARQAIELDEGLAEGHAALAMAQFRCDRDWISAEKEFKRALELNPNYATAHHWYAHYLMAADRIEEALAESNRAYDLSPIDPEMGVHLQWHYFMTGDYDQVILQGRKILEFDPTFNETHLYLGLAYEQKAMYQDAIIELETAVHLSGGRVIAKSSLGHAYAISGKRDAALKVLTELRDSSKQRYISSYDFAMLYLGLGNKDQAMARLEKAYQEGSYWLFTLKCEPRLYPLRSDPRFQRLLHRVGLSERKLG